MGRIKKGLIMLLATLFTVLGVHASAMTVEAKELTNAITDISLWDVGGGSVPTNDSGVYKLVQHNNYRFEVGFDLSKYDGQLVDGDVFTFTVPAPITAVDTSFDLVDKELNIAFGTVVATSNGTGKGGTVTVTLKNLEEYLQKKGGVQIQGVNGRFYIPFKVRELLDRYDVNYLEDETQGKLVHTISVVENGKKDFTDTIGNENFAKVGGAIRPTAWQSDILNKSGEHLHPWVVRVNTNQDSYETITINDEIPVDSAPMQYIPETLEILSGYYDASTLQLKDSPEKLEVGKDYIVEYDRSYTTMKIHILNPATRMAKNGQAAAYRITYATTSPEDGSIVVNEASMLADGNPISVGRKRYSEQFISRAERTSKVTIGGNIHLDVSYRISLYKVDSETNNRLSGATFEITSPTGEKESVVTNNQGVAQSKVYTENEIQAGNFTVVETEAPAGYVLDPTPIEVTVTSSGAVRTIKNTREKIAIPVQKVWQDADNQDGKRPESVTIQLLANGQEVPGKTLTLNAENNWKATFDKLNKSDDQGTEMVYSLKEVEVPEGYQSTITGDTTTGFTVTNTYSPATMEVSGTKTWADNNNQDGKRPEQLVIKLFKTVGGQMTEVQTKEISAKDDWTYSFTNLPKFENGQEIIYTVDEDLPEGYTKTVDGYHLTNAYTPEVTEVSGTKTWEDSDNQDGKRPDSITVYLLANGQTVASKTVTATDNWSYSFANLAKYKDGKLIAYAISEEAVSSYNTTVDGYNLTNRYSPEMIDVTVQKKWEDGDNQDGKRPTTITVHLLADGERVDTQTIQADVAGNWSATFTNKPKYAKGQAICYTVEEGAVAEYSSTIIADGNNYTITNSYTPQKISLKGSKVWNDGNNQDGIRPSSITVHLFANGVDTGKTAFASEATGWNYSFEELDQYQNGQIIQYTVQEDAVAGYTTQIDGTLITNSHVPKETPPAPNPLKDDSKDSKTPATPKDDMSGSQNVLLKSQKILPATNSTTSLGLIILGLSLMTGVGTYLATKRK